MQNLSANYFPTTIKKVSNGEEKFFAIFRQTSKSIVQKF
ncbi:hypothetical protein T4B_1846 [Trichinella pseudospiralis]|uniref:Uncharacterized protein n=1 Tax=Trichinella pseudospiralis TaxID=6337 RepID=A0A0V1G7D5_TRIPS|nr:hypothetical protein T4B_1846 [Trichinella pseudospiralis]